MQSIAVLLIELILITTSCLISYAKAQSVWPLRVMTINTWNSGRNVVDGLEKIAFHIQINHPDVVALQGIERVNGKSVLDLLINLLGQPLTGIEHSGLTPDTAIISRYPLIPSTASETSTACGVLIDIASSPSDPRIIKIWSVNLDHENYGPYFACGLLDEVKPRELKKEIEDWEENKSRRVRQVEELLQSRSILGELERDVNSATPLIILGHFHSPSHLDWTEANSWLHCGRQVRWPASLLMQKNGFGDAFRLVHPDPFAEPGTTWSVTEKLHMDEKIAHDFHAKLLPEPQDRIDYVFYRSTRLAPIDAKIYSGLEPNAQLMFGNVAKNVWPTSHAAVIVDFNVIL